MSKAPRKEPAKAGAKRAPPPVRRSAAPTHASTSPAPDGPEVAGLVRDLGQMIDAARKQVAVAANAALTTLYRQLGHHVRTQVLEGRRAEYGAQIVPAVGRGLETRYGRGFGEKNLRRMMQFATVFPDAEIVAALRRQLGLAHFKRLIPLKDALQREFYAELCRLECWSTRELADRIDAMLYERTALSKKPEALIRSSRPAGTLRISQRC